MLFNSFQFIWLFPVIFIVYYFCIYLVDKTYNVKNNHSRISNYLLLIFSYLLYAQWDLAYTLLLLSVTALTYVGAIIVERNENRSKVSLLMSFFVILTILPLLIFKYYDFIHFQLGNLLSSFNIGEIKLKGLNWAIPLGISFYTFQAVGYLIDVYYKRTEVERNW